MKQTLEADADGSALPASHLPGKSDRAWTGRLHAIPARYHYSEERTRCIENIDGGDSDGSENNNISDLFFAPLDSESHNGQPRESNLFVEYTLKMS